MTNSDIIGNVMYYLVKPPSVSDTVVVDIDVSSPVGTAPVDIAAAATAESPKKRISLVYTQSEAPKEAGKLSVTTSFQTVEKVITQHNVQYENPEPMRTGPLALMKRRSTRTKPTLVSDLSRRNTTTNSYPVTDIVPNTNAVSTGETRSVTSQLPMGTISVGEQLISVIPNGTVTRFTVPVPAEQLEVVIPKTQRGTRRSLSYRNAVSASGVPASFLEWAQMISEEQSCDIENGEFDIVNFVGRVSSANTPMLQTPKSGKTIMSALEPMIEEEEEKKSVNEEIKEDGNFGAVASQPQEAAKVGDLVVDATQPLKVSPKIVFYDAVYFANDNDFLETSKIRQIFRNNAIMAEDAKLFEMKEFTGDDATGQDFEIVRDTFPCECCYPSDEELNGMIPTVRFLHTHKCMILASFVSLLVISKNYVFNRSFYRSRDDYFE